MSEEENRFPAPPPPPGQIPKMAWVFLALFPSVIGLACLRAKDPSIGVLCAVVDLACAIWAARGLVRGMEGPPRILLALFLVCFFFVLNVIIVVLVGCSDMGRI